MSLTAALLSLLCGLLWAGLDAARKGLALHVAALPLVVSGGIAASLFLLLLFRSRLAGLSPLRGKWPLFFWGWSCC